MTKKVYFYIFILICGLLPISNYSLWGDEAWTIVEYGLQPDLYNVFKALLRSIGGDAQFPGYNIYIWGWIKIFGASEYSTRLANLPLFFGALIYTFLCLPRSCKFRIGFIISICLSPLIWYYLNETRYIIAVFSFSLISLVSLINYFEGNEKNKKFSAYMFLGSVVLGTAFMMLYVFYLILLTALIYFYLKTTNENVKSLIGKWKIPLIISLILMLVMGGYYTYTILNGMGGTRLDPNFKNIVFVLYEFLGFGGIGPPRNVLRESNTIEFGSSYFFAVIGFALFYVALLILLLLNYKKSKDRLSIFGMLAISVTFVIFYFFAEKFQFKFLSRHIVFLYTPFLFFTYTLVYNLLLELPKIRLGIIIIYFLGLTYSNYYIRFDPDYKKANIFNAFNIVSKEAKGLKVIWTEDRRGFDYYAMNRKGMINYNKNNYIFIETKDEDHGIKIINDHIKRERFLILILNKRDYNSEYKRFLTSKSYKIIYRDKDYTVYR